MRAKMMLITPSMAEELLKLNVSNRRQRRWWAQALAAAMRRGEWKATHQGIAFSISGKLIDGQHRLMAILISGISQLMLVVHDVPDDAFSVLDIGVKRTISDTTGLSKKTAEACRLAAVIVNGGSVTPQQVTEVANGGFGEVHERLLEACNSSVALYTAAPMRVAACIQIMDGHPEDYILSLYRKLALRNFEELPPIGYAFVRQVTAGKVSATGQIQGELLARALKLFNPDYSNVSRVQIGDGDTSAALAMVRAILRRSLTDDEPKPKQHANTTNTQPL